MSDDIKSCRSKNKRGQPCGAAVTESGYCHLHTNPDRAAELGRLGGRQNRHVVEVLRPLPAMDSTAGVAAAAEQLAGDVYAGRLHTKKAAGIAPLFNTVLRARHQEEMEQKLKQMQAQIDRLSASVAIGGANETKEDQNDQA